MTIQSVLEELVERVAFDERGVRNWNTLYAQATAKLKALMVECVSEEEFKKMLRDYTVMGMPETVKIWTRHINPLAKQLSTDIKQKVGLL